MRILSVLLFLGIFMLANSSAQTTIDLEQAIEIAQEKSIEIKQAFIQSKSAEIDKKQSHHQLFPSLNAGGSYGQSFGRTIDPTSNTFVTENIGYNSWNANANINLFSGGRIHHSIKQAQINLESAQATLEQNKRDIALNVATAYLTVLSAEDRLESAKNQLAISKDQVNRVQVLIDAGSQPQNAILDVEAQLLNDEQSLVIAENQLVLSKLNLKRWLLMEDETIEIVRPDLGELELLSEEIVGFSEIYNKALKTDQGLIADSLNIISAHKSILIAQSSYYPRLSLGGSLSTNYSSKGVKIIGQNTFINEVPIEFMGEMTTIGFPSSTPIIEESSYAEQLENNFGYSFGLNLNIPIYNNYQVKAQVQKAKLNEIRQELSYENNKYLLRQEVANARAEALAAQKLYAASIKTYESLNTAYENLVKRFDIGAANNYDLITAKNRLETAQINMINSKYDLLFKLKVIDFYLGKQITIK